MDRDGDGYNLSTGRRIYANNGILGISPTGWDHPDTPKAFEGYDGGMDEQDDLTVTERGEIAEYVISLWKRWAGKE